MHDPIAEGYRRFFFWLSKRANVTWFFFLVSEGKVIPIPRRLKKTYMRQMTTIAGLVSPSSRTRTSASSDANRCGEDRKPRRDYIRDKIQFAIKTFYHLWVLVFELGPYTTIACDYQGLPFYLIFIISFSFFFSCFFGPVVLICRVKPHVPS